MFSVMVRSMIHSRVLLGKSNSTLVINIPRIYTRTLKKLQENVLCQKYIVYDQLENDIIKVFCIWVMGGKGRYDVIKNKPLIAM